MNTVEAREAGLLVNKELFSLTPSTIITLFEIDVSELVLDTSILNDTNLSTTMGVFRFHNSLKVTNNSIFWRDNEYFAAPISAEGFETNSKGTLPIPKLKITVSEDGIPIFSYMKEKLFQLGDLAGAKVTRIKVFAKYLDSKNFSQIAAPEGFSPNPNVEVGRDIFYVERKVLENKYLMELDLSSILDLEGLQLPGRLIIGNRCTHLYRDPETCGYPWRDKLFTENDESIRDIVGTDLIWKGLYKVGATYQKGHTVYLERAGIWYLFVAKVDNPLTGPPNLNYWVSDKCSKTLDGCGKRFALPASRYNPDPKNVTDKVVGFLPFGGFPGVVRMTEIS